MKDRIKHKIEKRRRADIHKVLDLVLDMNGLGLRQKKSTGNLPTAFFEFSGHTACTYISIHKDGWEPYAGADYRFDTHVTQKDQACLIRKLEDIKHELSL